MSKKLKYIKIHGKITAMGTYDTIDVDIRPYEAVTVKDDAGDEIHFRMLMVPTRIDDKLKIDDEATFYILRHKNKKGQYAGALYAIDINGEKLFYPIDGWKAAKGLAQGLSMRYQLSRNPMVLLGGAGFAAVFFGFIVALIFFALIGEKSAVLFGSIAGFTWIYFFMFPLVKSKRFAGQDIMLETMRVGGFVPLHAQPVSDKY